MLFSLLNGKRYFSGYNNHHQFTLKKESTEPIIIVPHYEKCVTITWKCWMPLRTKLTAKLTLIIEHSGTNANVRETLFVSINIGPWCLVFFFNLHFLLLQQFASSDLPAE